MYVPGVAWYIYILADVCMYQVLPGVYIYFCLRVYLKLFWQE